MNRRRRNQQQVNENQMEEEVQDSGEDSDYYNSQDGERAPSSPPDPESEYVESETESEDLHSDNDYSNEDPEIRADDV